MSNHEWAAGLLDAVGHIYQRKGGGFNIRMRLPEATLAYVLRNLYGGSVNDQLRTWTLRDNDELQEFIGQVYTPTRGQRLSLAMLDEWLHHRAGADHTAIALDDFYKDYKVRQ